MNHARTRQKKQTKHTHLMAVLKQDFASQTTFGVLLGVFNREEEKKKEKKTTQTPLTKDITSTKHILKTPPGIELRLVLLPRRLALIDTPPEPIPPLSDSLLTLRCVATSSEPNRLSARSGKCLWKPQNALEV